MESLSFLGYLHLFLKFRKFSRYYFFKYFIGLKTLFLSLLDFDYMSGNLVTKLFLTLCDPMDGSHLSIRLLLIFKVLGFLSFFPVLIESFLLIYLQVYWFFPLSILLLCWAHLEFFPVAVFFFFLILKFFFISSNSLLRYSNFQVCL